MTFKPVAPKISSQYKADRIFSNLQIQDGRVLKKIIDKLDLLILTDIKGHAFEYFLKAASATGNDLGEYFTPNTFERISKEMIH